MDSFKYAVIAGVGAIGYGLYRAMSNPQTPLTIKSANFDLAPSSVVVGTAKGASASITASGSVKNTGNIPSASLRVSLDAFLNNGFLRAGWKTDFFTLQPGATQQFALPGAVVYETDPAGNVTGVLRLWDSNGKLIDTKVSAILATIEAPPQPAPTQQVSGYFISGAPSWDASISGYEFWSLAGIAVNNGNATTVYSFHLETLVYDQNGSLVQQFDDVGSASRTLAPGASNAGDAVSVTRNLTPTSGWYTKSRGRLDATSPEARIGLAYTAWTTHSY